MNQLMLNSTFGELEEFLENYKIWKNLRLSDDTTALRFLKETDLKNKDKVDKITNGLGISLRSVELLQTCNKTNLKTIRLVVNLRKQEKENACKKIQKQLRESMYNPRYKMCKNIMRRKFEESK